MMCRDNQAFSLVENEGFQFFMHKALPLYSLPCRKTFTNLLDGKYEGQVPKFKAQLSQYEYFTMTTDVWTEQHTNKSYLGVTIHYLDNIDMQSTQLGVFPLEERHTAQYLEQILNQICTEWNLPKQKVIAVITDNAANIVKAVTNYFGELNHLPCFAHTLNLVCERSLEMSEAVAVVIVKLRNIVTWFKHSIVGTDMLRKLQLKDGISEGKLLKLKQDVRTRWNSTFCMLERYLILCNYVNEILLNDPKSPTVLNANELQILRELKVLLRPLEVCTREVSAEKYVTLSKIIPLMNCMVKEILNTKPSNVDVEQFKQNL